MASKDHQALGLVLFEFVKPAGTNIIVKIRSKVNEEKLNLHAL